MEKLPEDFKQKWVAALRSGEFQQAKECLYDIHTNSYCCLGVACRVAGYSGELPAHDAGEWIANDAVFIPKAIRGNDSNEVVEILSKMNDSGVRFTEIADYIEQNL
jgi:hypothetical protein